MSSLHKEIGQRAYELLPEWEQDFWKTEAGNLPEYCEYPDLHLGEQWGDPDKLSFYEKYCVMPNGICIPHGPVDSEWHCSAFASSLEPENTEYSLLYYSAKVIELLRAGNVLESARFAGTLAHMLQDCSVPVHSMNNIMINQLFPYRDGRYFNYHRIGDGWPFKPESVTEKAKLIGRNEAELVFAAIEDIFNKIENNAGTIVPFIEAVQNQKNEIADAISRQFNSGAVQLTADVWHTLFSIAFNHFEETELQAFQKRPLTASKMIQSYTEKFDRKKFIDAGIPFYPTIYPESDCCRSRLSTDPYPFEPVINTAFDGKGNLIPLELRIDGKRKKALQGIAAGAYCIASFRIPGTIFSELEVYVGIHPESKSDKTVTVGIWCYEIKEPLLAFGKISLNTNALHFKVRLPEECRTISLLSADGNNNTSVIWFDPKLIYRDIKQMHKKTNERHLRRLHGM